MGHPPLGCFRLAVLLPAVRAKLSTWEKDALQHLTITVPCRAKPLFPSCAWGCGQLMLQVVPKGEPGGEEGWTGFPFLPPHHESTLPSKGHSEELTYTAPMCECCWADGKWYKAMPLLPGPENPLMWLWASHLPWDLFHQGSLG